MKRADVIRFTALFLATIASAQDTTIGDNRVSSETKQSKSELRTVVGCLSSTANTYVITGGGPGPKQFRIVGGDTSPLKGKIGHTVKVVGLVGANDPVENIITPYNEGTTTGVGYNTIVAQKIQDVYGN